MNSQAAEGDQLFYASDLPADEQFPQEEVAEDRIQNINPANYKVLKPLNPYGMGGSANGNSAAITGGGNNTSGNISSSSNNNK